MMYIFAENGVFYPVKGNESKTDLLLQQGVQYAIINTEKFLEIDWDYLDVVMPENRMQVALKKQTQYI